MKNDEVLIFRENWANEATEIQDQVYQQKCGSDHLISNTVIVVLSIKGPSLRGSVNPQCRT